MHTLSGEATLAFSFLHPILMGVNSYRKDLLPCIIKLHLVMRCLNCFLYAVSHIEFDLEKSHPKILKVGNHVSLHHKMTKKQTAKCMSLKFQKMICPCYIVS